MNKKFFNLLFVASLTLASCSNNNNQTKQTDDKIIYVKTYTTKKLADVDIEKYIGVIDDITSAVISFPVSGNIKQILVEEGQTVAENQLLAVLDGNNLQSIYNVAKATLNQAEDGMERVQKLYDSKSLPEIKYIETKTKLEKAIANEAIAKNNLNKSRITAPFSGVIGNITADVGENILPDQTVLTLVKINQVKVKIAVPEKEIFDFKVGQNLNVFVAAADNDSIVGKVVQKGVVADKISHSYSVYILVDNAQKKLLPGMVANAYRNNDNSTPIVSVPNQCVMKNGNGETFVWKIVNGKAKKQTVTVGKQTSNGVAVTKGLSVGDNVVIEGYQKLVEELKVSVL